MPLLPVLVAYKQDMLWTADGKSVCLKRVLDAAVESQCTIIFITDGSRLFDIKFQVFFEAEYNVATFKMEESIWETNASQTRASHLLAGARRVRRTVKCVVVVVVSDNPEFIDTFAIFSLKNRLLGGSTKLIIFTRLGFQLVNQLLSSRWTLSMMNTMIFNQEQNNPIRLIGYVYFPYGHKGPAVERIAAWTANKGLWLYSTLPLFPEKFSNFHGEVVNVTALPYTPHWVEEIEQDENFSAVKRYSGTDYFLLSSIASTLNFKINVIPTSSWDEVAMRVEERKSFMATVFHNMLPQRLKRYDYSCTYEYGSLDFSAAKPSLRPRWQSLYYPLSNEVWIAVLGALLVVPISVYLFSLTGLNATSQSMDIVEASQMVVATFLSQNLSKKLPHSNSSRSLVAAWLVFVLVVGTVYRGNLTAALTLPKYPPRTETVQQLVESFSSITMPPFGKEFISFFKQSNSTLYKTLAGKMSIVPDVITGLQRAKDTREAHVAGRRYMEQMIARHFTLPDGSARLYVGRESILPGISAWPIPHDASYRYQMDRLMMAVVEAGIYEKWSDDMLRKTRKEARAIQRKEFPEQPNKDEDSINALTTLHMQGPLLLLLLCLATAIFIFASELFLHTRKKK